MLEVVPCKMCEESKQGGEEGGSDKVLDLSQVRRVGEEGGEGMLENETAAGWNQRICHGASEDGNHGRIEGWVKRVRRECGGWEQEVARRGSMEDGEDPGEENECTSSQHNTINQELCAGSDHEQKQWGVSSAGIGEYQKRAQRKPAKRAGNEGRFG